MMKSFCDSCGCELSVSNRLPIYLNWNVCMVDHQRPSEILADLAAGVKDSSKLIELIGKYGEVIVEEQW